MSANAKTAAPTGRKKLAQGKAHSDTALGHESQNTSSTEKAKEDGGLGKAHQLFGEQLPKLLDELNEVLAA